VPRVWDTVDVQPCGSLSQECVHDVDITPATAATSTATISVSDLNKGRLQWHCKSDC